MKNPILIIVILFNGLILQKRMSIVLFFFTIILPLGLLAQKANIQVVAEPGISVYIDETFQGKTSLDYDGLIIENVLSGSRIIKLIKEGFNPQEERINIKLGEVYTYTVRPFIPKIKIYESGNTGQQEIALKVGNLKIQSLPISITIKIPSLGVNYSKRKDEWNAEEIPAGIYSATFTYKDQSLSHQIKIAHNKTTRLMVNMLREDIIEDTIDNIVEEEVIPEPVVNQGSASSKFDNGKPDEYEDADNYDGQNGKGNGPGFSLGGRGKLYLEEPNTDFKEQGTVVVNIWVDREGNVAKAQVKAKGTTIVDSKMRRLAEESAKNSKFEKKADTEELQRGTITYKFILGK